jgi:DNA polymerase-3 subunit epsilon
MAWPAPRAGVAPVGLTAPVGLRPPVAAERVEGFAPLVHTAPRVRPEPPDVPLSELRIAVIDVETSGLRPDRDRVLQVGLVRLTATGVETDRWDTLLKAPWRRLRGRRIHGLSRRSLRGAPRFDDVMPELVAALDGHIVCAHNVAFDWPFLVRALRRDGYEAPDALRLCTLRLSRSLDPDRTRSHRLPDVCERYGIPLDRAHHAGADAIATASLLVPLLAEAGITDVDGLRPHLEGSTTRWAPVDADRHPAHRFQPVGTLDGTGPLLGPRWPGLADPLVRPNGSAPITPPSPGSPQR